MNKAMKLTAEYLLACACSYVVCNTLEKPLDKVEDVIGDKVRVIKWKRAAKKAAKKNKQIVAGYLDCSDNYDEPELEFIS